MTDGDAMRAALKRKMPPDAYGAFERFVEGQAAVIGRGFLERKMIEPRTEEVLASFPFADHVHISFDPDELVTAYKEHEQLYRIRKKMRKMEEWEKQKAALNAIVDEHIPGGFIASMEFHQSGNLEDDECSHYFYGSRYDIDDEFETKFDAHLSIRLDIGGCNHLFEADVDLYQDADVGDDKIMFTTHTNCHATDIGDLVHCPKEHGVSKEQVKKFLRAALKELIDEPRAHVMEHVYF